MSTPFSAFKASTIASIYMFYFPITLMVMSLLYLKSSQDILQGISKLDYLLKVSVFQLYKDKELEEDDSRDMTVGPTSTFQRVSSSINDPLSGSEPSNIIED
mmetsp:Transcript_3240/g.4934  ORF Transcript_3240/g.4934 Transcript_3240/m.4934 type:complete len:102 (+) Transcript_3240:1113-1418(+)